MRNIRIALAGTGVLALVAATVLPLTAQSAQAAPTQIPVFADQSSEIPNYEELLALEQAAAASGEDTWGVSFSHTVDRVKEAFPDDYGAAEIHEDQSSGWIAFKGAVPNGAEDVVRELPGIELRGDLGQSEKEISATVDLLFDSLLETHGNDFQVSVIPVPREREILVEYVPSTTARISAESVAESVRSATLATDLGGFSVRAEATDGGMVSELVLQHGARVLAGVCTGAFPVKHKYGPELGILIAGHCPGTGSYDGIANAFHNPVNYSLSTSTGSGGGDFRWNHSKYGLSGQTLSEGGGNRFGCLTSTLSLSLACSFASTARPQTMVARSSPPADSTPPALCQTPGTPTRSAVFAKRVRASPPSETPADRGSRAPQQSVSTTAQLLAGDPRSARCETHFRRLESIL